MLEQYLKIMCMSWVTKRANYSCEKSLFLKLFPVKNEILLYTSHYFVLHTVTPSLIF